jgi:preprotein translocase subunit YajC
MKKFVRFTQFNFKKEVEMKGKIYSLLLLSSLFVTGSVFAEGVEPVPMPADQSFVQTLVMIAIGIIFFYVILWRPEQKRRKAMEEQRSSLKQGDRVSAMGILGTVIRVEDQTVIVKMYDGSKLEFYKAAITDILPEEEKQKIEEVKK